MSTRLRSTFRAAGSGIPAVVILAVWVLFSCQKDRIGSIDTGGEGECLLDKASLDFGTIPLNSSAVDSFVLRNVGTGPLNGRIRGACGGFTLVSGGGSYSLASGQRRIVVVRFQPFQPGTLECVVQIGGPCRGVHVSGIGASPPLCEVEPTHLDFDTVQVGQTADRTFTIRNAGQGTLSGAIGSDCSAFTVVDGDTAYALGALESKTFTIRFAPDAPGFQACTILTGTPCLDQVSTQGVAEEAPLCLLDPPSLDFGPVTIGSSSSGSFTIRNMGGGILHGAVGSPCAEFLLEDPDSSYSLRANQSRTFLLRFQPQGTGTRDCSIRTGGACAELPVTGAGLEPTGACCAADGTCRVTTETDCAADWLGSGTTCAPNPCPQPTGACCAADGSCTVATQAECTDNWHGMGTSCSPNPCPQPTGACCYSDGACLVSTSSDCAQAGGSYEGNGTGCAPNPCPQPTGACCAADGSCTVTTQADCAGNWLATATTCSPNPCPQPTGACCATDGTCTVTTQAACADTWLGADTACVPNPCAQPLGACCEATGTCTSATEADCTGQWLGLGTSCSPNPCPQPTGACCAADGTCTVATQAACAGNWLGMGTTCSPNPCPQPTGACCAADGSCIVTTQADCAGNWLGMGTTCSPNPCPQPTGACCAADGSCTVTTQADCAGNWLGMGTGCSPNPCPQPTGACCATDGSCTVTTQAGCADNWLGTATACSPNPCPRCSIDPASLQVDLGTVQVGSYADGQFTIHNTGGSSFSGDVTMDCPGFSIPSGGGPFTLAPGASRTVIVRYTPLQPGDASCTVDLNTGLCPDVDVIAHGESAPVCSLSTTELDFGLVVADGAHFASRSFTLTNTGGGTLSGSVTEDCLEYAITSTASYSLGAGQSQTFTIRFRPQQNAFGTKTCTVHTGSLCADVNCTGEAAPGFLEHVQPLLQGSCSGCHYDGSGLPVVTDYNVLLDPQNPLVDTADPPQSLVLQKPSGQQSHGGGVIPGWSVGESSYNLVLLWIMLGALDD